MSFAQVIAPNLNTVGNVGWCLAFVEKAFDATTYSYATARDGWDACQFVHTDRNLPDNVCVPVWFDYYENGINYGHVAISVPGRGILSSPYRNNNTQQWEPDINTIARIYNSTYLGWSEDLMGVRVIKQGGAMSFIEPATIRSLSQDFDVPLTDDQVAYYSKHPSGYTELYTDFLKYNYDKRKQAESAALGTAIVLKAGVYKVN